MADRQAEAPAPDISLIPAPTVADSAEPYTHKQLTYPFGRRAPGDGELIEVASGIGWARLPVPGSLKHINVWSLDDAAAGSEPGAGGVALVDSGLDIPECRAAWERLFEGPLAGRRITRLIVTHFHPDHVGLAGWLCERFGIGLAMTRGEWLFARLLAADVRDAPPPEAFVYWRAAGWPDERIAAEAAKGWGRFAAMVSPVPAAFRRIVEGDTIRIGDRAWRAVIGAGHCPEHLCLFAEQDGILIAGDQVLPKISSNVSLSLSEPEADPLGEWLASIAKLRALPDSVLVLPSHGEPFTGLHARLDALDHGHRDRLDALHARLDAPRRAVDCFATLFARRIEDKVMGLATGEALAHLRHLEVQGRAVRDNRDGVDWWRAA